MKHEEELKLAKEIFILAASKKIADARAMAERNELHSELKYLRGASKLAARLWVDQEA